MKYKTVSVVKVGFLLHERWLNELKQVWVESMDIRYSIHPDAMNQLSSILNDEMVNIDILR